MKVNTNNVRPEQNDRSEQSLQNEPKHLEPFSECETCPLNQRLSTGSREEAEIMSAPANSLNLIVHHLANEVSFFLLIQDEATFLYLDIIDLKKKINSTNLF